MKMMKKLGKNWRFLSHCLLSSATFSQRQQPVAFVVALNHLYPAMRAVLYQCNAMAIKTARGCGKFFMLFFCCRPGGRRGNTMWILARWRHPVAFWGSHGHAALGNVCAIALAHQQGYQNGLRWRCSFIASLILLSMITVANNHVMVHQN